jgi:hypothetical protein
MRFFYKNSKKLTVARHRSYLYSKKPIENSGNRQLKTPPQDSDLVNLLELCLKQHMMALAHDFVPPTKIALCSRARAM